MQTRSKSIYSLFIQPTLLVSPAGRAVTYTPAGILFARPVPEPALEGGQTKATKLLQEGITGRFKPKRIGWQRGRKRMPSRKKNFKHYCKHTSI
jgi:hypothetical protein